MIELLSHGVNVPACARRVLGIVWKPNQSLSAKDAANRIRRVREGAHGWRPVCGPFFCHGLSAFAVAIKSFKTVDFGDAGWLSSPTGRNALCQPTLVDIPRGISRRGSEEADAYARETVIAMLSDARKSGGWPAQRDQPPFCEPRVRPAWLLSASPEREAFERHVQRSHAHRRHRGHVDVGCSQFVVRQLPVL